MVMIKFHVCVREQPIDLVWDERLSSASTKFVELKNKVTGERSAPSTAGVDAALAPGN
jgi:hypothetical protein